jgi:hypothetical protein
MSARRFISTALASLCAFSGALVLWPAVVRAADQHDYLFQFGEVPSVGPHGEKIAVPGPLTFSRAMTVDDGEVYVAEGEANSRLDKFSATTGAFIAQFPQQPAPLEYLDQGVAVGHAGGETRVYVGGDELVGGTPFGVVTVYNAAGELRSVWKGAKTLDKGFDCFECGGTGDVAVDNSGLFSDWAANDVYVADPEHDVVDVFEPESGSGEGKPVAELSGVSPSEPFSKPTQVAVSTVDGEVVVDDESSAIDLFRPAAIAGQYEYVGKLATPSGHPFSGQVKLDAGDGEGDIYVTSEGQVFEFSAAGEYEGQVTPATAPGAMWGHENRPVSVAADPETHHVYVGTSVGNFTAAPAFAFGPNIVIPDVVTGPPSNLAPTSATLTGSVDLDGAGSATCRFVWGVAGELNASVPCAARVEGAGRVAVSAALTQLQADTTYYYRLEATNANGTNNGEPQLQHFTTPGPGGLESESVSDVASTSATFAAELSPHGRPTSYYFQYGQSAEYELAVPAAPGVALGSGEATLEASQHVQGLTADSLYHYRVVAVSELEVRPGVVEPVVFVGPDRTFATQGASAGSTLPDGRQWEMVSEPEKRGGQISGVAAGTVVQSALNGEGITYFATNLPAGAAQGNTNEVQILSTHGPAGWSSQTLTLPHAGATGVNGGAVEYQLFSEDLSSGLVRQNERSFSSLAPEVWPADTESTLYLRHDATCAATPATCFEPLVTSASGYDDEPAGTPAFGAEGVVVGASPDLGHVLLSGGGVLYEWSAAGSRAEALQPVSVLPSSEGGALVAGTVARAEQKVERYGVAADGSRVVWSAASGLYLRDMTDHQTVRLDAVQGGSGAGEAHATFQAASSDDSRVFFTDTQRLTSDSGAETTNGVGLPDLYECEIADEGGKPKCDLSDLTPLGPAGSANVQGSVIATSEDGSSIDFVANGVLTEVPSSEGERARPGDCSGESGSGSCNLYMLHYDTAAAKWEAPRLIAVLSGQDRADWNPLVAGQPTRVSPSGRYLAFMSSRSLTGYDNRDASSGAADAEVFLYDAQAERLVCASCNPTGGRPTGYEVGSHYEAGGGLIGGSERLVEESTWPSSEWVAAQTPGWSGAGAHQPRYLSNEGRLFFDSDDALVPQDINQTDDAYEYEPAGVGDCTSSLPTFSERAGGCIGLISSGLSHNESVFLDASENGSDVFFLTAEPLVAQDIDTAFDVYDAHICTSQSPCAKAPVAVPPCTTADSCRAAPLPQPSSFGAPASATFSGAGNVTASVPAPAAQLRKLTRSQALARALAACRKAKTGKRAACERRARKRYGQESKKKATDRSRKTSTTRRGTR